jgi:hypothetical protein
LRTIVAEYCAEFDQHRHYLSSRQTLRSIDLSAQSSVGWLFNRKRHVDRIASNQFVNLRRMPSRSALLSNYPVVRTNDPELALERFAPLGSRARFPRCLRRIAIRDPEEIDAAARLLMVMVGRTAHPTSPTKTKFRRHSDCAP